ncbi:hypothetical protein HPP92_012498 [Vanilla planifolia]|uniref:Uncharacterized protein n=1 Tax=Vanilla planifolia TaxID=51239 RepID=A0A835QX03_VANPL|nr:hypothetical protein HPP92_012498 [Vanilla planifolia]
MTFLRELYAEEGVDIGVDEPFLRALFLLTASSYQGNEEIDLPLTQPRHRLPPPVEDTFLDARQEGEEAHLTEVPEKLPARGHDLSNLLLLQLLPEAHENQEAKDGKLEAFHGIHGAVIGTGTTGTGVDVVSVAGKELTRGGERIRAVGEGGPLLDEGFVLEVPVGDEDRAVAADVEGDDGAVPSMQVAKEIVVDVGDRSPQPEKVAEDENGRRPGGRRSNLCFLNGWRSRR